MATTYLLKGGIVATWTNDGGAKAYKTDVLVEGSTITQIAEDISPRPGVEIIDCKNKWISPGFVDTHRHGFLEYTGSTGY